MGIIFINCWTTPYERMTWLEISHSCFSEPRQCRIGFVFLGLGVLLIFGKVVIGVKDDRT